jgi:excinuclease UvrABC nuclease subunit
MNFNLILAPYCVYRALDANDQVLYVGSTSDLRRRFLAHRRLSPWYAQCVAIEWTEHWTHKAMHREEYRLIRELRPPHNKAGLPKSHTAA